MNPRSLIQLSETLLVELMAGNIQVGTKFVFKLIWTSEEFFLASYKIKHMYCLNKLHDQLKKIM